MNVSPGFGLALLVESIESLGHETKRRAGRNAHTRGWLGTSRGPRPDFATVRSERRSNGLDETRRDARKFGCERENCRCRGIGLMRYDATRTAATRSSFACDSDGDSAC